MTNIDLDTLLDRALTAQGSARAESAGLWYVRQCIATKDSKRLLEASFNSALPQMVRDTAAVGYTGVCAANARTYLGSCNEFLDELLAIAAGDSKLTQRSKFKDSPELLTLDVVQRIKQAAASEYVKILIQKRHFGSLRLHVISDREEPIFSRADIETVKKACRAAGVKDTGYPPPSPYDSMLKSNACAMRKDDICAPPQFRGVGAGTNSDRKRNVLRHS